MEADSEKQVSKKKRQSLFAFISGLKEELKKVSWTTKPELLSATKIVILSTFCFGIGIYGVDLVVKGALETLKRALLFLFG